MRIFKFVVIILSLFVTVNLVFAADWDAHPMPYPLPNPIYQCERVHYPLWSFDEDSNLHRSDYIFKDQDRIFFYWAAFTKRPYKKKDYHIIGYDGSKLWSVQMMHYKDDGSRIWSELCSCDRYQYRSDCFEYAKHCLEAECRPQINR